MTTSSAGRPVTKGYTTLLLVTSSLTALLIVLGAVVCITESAQGCPDWPGCYGRIIPPLQVNAIIEYTHRLVAALTTALIATSVIATWARHRAIRWLIRPLALAVVFLLAVVAFGAIAVLRGLAPGFAALDLGSALMVLALLCTALVVAIARQRRPALPDRISFPNRAAKTTLWATAAVFATLVSGVLVAEPGSVERCLGLPLQLEPSQGWPYIVRRLIAGVAVALVIAVVAQQRRERQGKRTPIATAIAICLGIEVAIGLAIWLAGPTTPLLIANAALATALWALLVALTVRSGLPVPNNRVER